MQVRITSALLFAWLLPSLPSAMRSAAPKYVRAVIIYQPAPDSTIHVGTIEEATALYHDLVGPYSAGRLESEHTLSGRPCAAVAAFLGTRAEGVPLDSLRFEQATSQYWFYPAIGREPALLVAHRAGTAIRVTEQGLTSLARHGVVVTSAAGSRARCDRNDPPADAPAE